MENADGIAQWNASGSRKKSIVTAGSRGEQLEGIGSRSESGLFCGSYLLADSILQPL